VYYFTTCIEIVSTKHYRRVKLEQLTKLERKSTTRKGVNQQ